MQERQSREKPAPTRTCVGCGLRGAPSDMVRLVVADAEVVFDLAGGAFGRGVHLHPTPSCLAKRAARPRPWVQARPAGRRCGASVAASSPHATGG